MPQHETHNCPRCNGLFECKTGSIELCQCTAIQLNREEREYIQKLFSDCLCIQCLQELKSEFHQLQHQKNLEKISPLFSKNNPFDSK